MYTISPHYICQNNTNTPTAIVSNKMWRAYLAWGLPWFIVKPSRRRQLKPEGQERYSYTTLSGRGRVTLWGNPINVAQTTYSYGYMK